MVSRFAMTRKARTKTLHHTTIFLLIEVDASIQQAAVLGKAAQSHGEDDCKCHYQFFHRLFNFVLFVD